jgi:hypothetical protein
MSVRRDQLKLRPEQTNLSPSFRFATDAPEILQAEQFVWDLTSFNVSFREESGATLATTSGDKQILNLGELEDFGRRSATFDANALTARSDGKSQAVIQVTAGTGTAQHVSVTDQGLLLPQGNAKVNLDEDFVLDPGGAPRVFKLLDLVEFEIPRKDDEPQLTFDLHSTAGRDGLITVFAGSDSDEEIEKRENKKAKEDKNYKSKFIATDTVVVSFSHICSSRPRPRKYDFEFAQYYSLLQKDPADAALILRPSQSAGEGGDCEYKALIKYERKDGTLLKK